MEDQSKNIIPIIISAYAAIISTITLVWNIINSILDKRDKITVDARFNQTMFWSEGGKMISGPILLVVSIVNHSKRMKYIKVPSLKFSYHHGNKISDDNDDTIVNLHYKSGIVKFPIELKPESEVTLEYPLALGSGWFLNNSTDKSTFKVRVVDTINKEYTSKKVSISQLKECIEFNSKLDSNIFELYNSAFNNK